MSDPRQSHEDTRAQAPCLQLHAPVPDFEAETTHGYIGLYDWHPDKWVVLFSHPADFTPVCTSEFVSLAEASPQFQERNVVLLGCSVDSVFSHLAWLESIRNKFHIDVPFPIIADVDQKVARLYGMVHEASSNTAPVRAMFIIDPERRLRAMFHYPLEAGRSTDELLRLIDALQTADRHDVQCPADWSPGQPVLTDPPRTVNQLRLQSNAGFVEVVDWYYQSRDVDKDS
ncbi:peroxiredoxin [Persicimonas caeni]|uniref:Peroxiredoxin n=1 Tax=Persicimonas caeni TaxID=2292766 RepID=A0A4Y6Q0Z4_PERCE|nr:peroxiredoxin [Persicimonas caeni]QDG53665.1 peroxiredoxin [Persicimonas caeni]QED34886.1 peroxiredoxin [Persicimonas caeni]